MRDESPLEIPEIFENIETMVFGYLKQMCIRDSCNPLPYLAGKYSGQTNLLYLIDVYKRQNMECIAEGLGVLQNGIPDILLVVHRAAVFVGADKGHLGQIAQNAEQICII